MMGYHIAGGLALVTTPRIIVMMCFHFSGYCRKSMPPVLLSAIDFQYP